MLARSLVALPFSHPSPSGSGLLALAPLGRLPALLTLAERERLRAGAFVAAVRGRCRRRSPTPTPTSSRPQAATTAPTTAAVAAPRYIIIVARTNMPGSLLPTMAIGDLLGTDDGIRPMRTRTQSNEYVQIREAELSNKKRGKNRKKEIL